MSNYTITTNFGAKDSLPSGNAGKVIKGSEFTTEFTNIQTAIATKADTAGDTFTGVVNFSADVAVNTNTLFVDVSADKVGIGTSSPLADLHVSNGTNSDSTPVEFMIGGSANSVRTGSIVKGTTSGAYDLTLQTSNHASQNQPLIIKLSDATEAMRIDSAGNVGIGTSSPAYALDVTGSAQLSGGDLILRSDSDNADTQYIRFENYPSDIRTAYIRADYTSQASGGGTALAFGANDHATATDTDSMVIDIEGKVGIGTTSPANTLTVGNLTASANDQDATVGIKCNANHRGIILQENSGAEQWEIGVGAAGALKFYDSGSATPAVTFADETGNVGIGTSSPASRLAIHGAADVAHIVQTNTANSQKLEIGNAYSLYTGASGSVSAIASDSALAFATNDAERMRIDSSGNVGIGTASPDSPLEVQGSVNGVHEVHIQNTFNDNDNTGDNPSSKLRLSAVSNNGYIECHGAPQDAASNHRVDIGSTAANSFLTFSLNSTERMRIDSSGNVGIGETNPSNPFHLKATTNIPALIETTHSSGNSRLRFNTASGTDWSIGGNNNGNFTLFDAVNSNNCFIVEAGATENTLVIDSNSRVGIGTSSPNESLVVKGGTYAANQSGGMALQMGDTSGSHWQSSFKIKSDGSGNVRTAIDASTGATGGQSQEVISINTAGNVGIGTTSPAATLHVQAAGEALQLNNANEDTYMKVCGTRALFGYRAADGHAIVQGAGSKGIAFCVNNATFGSGEAMRIRSSGKLVIGKTDESVIDTVGIEAHPTGLLVATRDGNVPLIANRKTSDGVVAQFRKDNTPVGSISVTSSATAYNTSSDERLKENIADSADAGSKVDAIHIRQFDWKADGSHQDYGVIAQELVTVAPEAVHQPEDAEEMMGVDYSKLVPMLIKEIQSLRSRVAELENQ